MLRVFKASGEHAFEISFAELAEMLDEEPVTCLALKRHLPHICGQTRFKQRLLHADGQILFDDAVLGENMDLQLVFLPFEAFSVDHAIQLQQAAQDGDIPALEQLLQMPQDPDLEHGGWCALHAACHNGHPAAAGLLLEAKADKDMACDHAAPPLTIAACEGHLEVVNLLLEVNADKDKAFDADEGQTPIFMASQEGHFEIVRLLLEANATSAAWR